jgi:hypothetical protein
MSNQGYWKDIAIINNFHVYTKTNSKQKHMNKTQKHETENAVTVQFRCDLHAVI